AAEATTANFLPIIVTAGLTVAAGTAAMVVARLEFVRAFGPALALTVAISLLVAITIVPAALAIFERALFWPHPESEGTVPGDPLADGDPPGRDRPGSAEGRPGQPGGPGRPPAGDRGGPGASGGGRRPGPSRLGGPEGQPARRGNNDLQERGGREAGRDPRE